MVEALAAGAGEIAPCLEIDEARRLAASLPAGRYVLGGERHGVRIEGFDLGNSPAEYASSIVRGKTVVLTTTNGTRAMGVCRPAARALVAGFVNASATVAALQAAALGDAANIHVLCAGTDGHIGLEDALLAGWLAVRWQEATGAGRETFDDQAALAMAAAREIVDAADPQAALVAALRASRGGANLADLGFDADIALAAELDRHAVTVEFEPKSLRTTVARRA